MGFDNVPEAVGHSLDLDVILRFSEIQRLENDDQFWEAQQQLNKTLVTSGLYMTHLFQEDQVFLRPEWEKYIQPALRPSTRWLKFFRPDTVDLILTKMMRGTDAQDMEDVEFLVRQGNITRAQMEQAFATVRIPDVEELHAAFQEALHKVRQTLTSR